MKRERKRVTKVNGHFSWSYLSNSIPLFSSNQLNCSLRPQEVPGCTNAALRVISVLMFFQMAVTWERVRD